MAMVNINELHTRIRLINSVSSFNNFFLDIKNTYNYVQMGIVIFELSDLFQFDVSHFGNFNDAFLDNIKSNNELVRYCVNEVKTIQLSELSKGCESTLIIPISLHNNKFACLVIELPSLSVESHNIQVMGDYWRIFLVEIFEAYRRVFSSNAVKITRREKECIQWASMGKTSWEISQILSISQRTVDFHLTNCIRKTNSTNRQHAIVKCILSGQLLT
ncbi:LuxR family transcriptional regulator [Pseudoalteromonas fuliginea]|uniref:LuxR family transcriptional regulator n=2 Tax=Pseudoalteromonas fuliginea TaxID=1872678 RepID=A0ABQ6RLT1_9GAMM|nr:LuxR family transcriptional regulator [Pseudoalteromonas fuliginea]KAA1168652.1 LuxR family transcriptional regulator [Pseudoalteromonas fuliginea]